MDGKKTQLIVEMVAYLLPFIRKRIALLYQGSSFY